MKHYPLEVYDATIDALLNKYDLELKDEVDQFLIDKEQTNLLLDAIKENKEANKK